MGTLSHMWSPRIGCIVMAVALPGCSQIFGLDETSLSFEPDAAPDSAVARKYVASVPATGATIFGGGAYCTYSITLRQIELMVQVTAGAVTAATVQNMTSEAIEPTTPVCPYGPAAPSTQAFALLSATPTAGGANLVMQGNGENQPATTLTITFTFDDTFGQATMRWNRTDQVPVLNWSVAAGVTLTIAAP